MTRPFTFIDFVVVVVRFAAADLISYNVSGDGRLDKLPDWAENLQDISYDGIVSNDGRMTNGLGQLTDGVVNDNRTTSNGTFFGKFSFFCFFFGRFMTP